MNRVSLMAMMLAVAAMLAPPACSNKKAMFNQSGSTGIGDAGGGMGSGGNGY